MSLKIFQRALTQKLSEMYPDSHTQSEWASMSDEDGMYSPRLDIAVGPYSTTANESLSDKYDNLMDSTKPFIEKMIFLHTQNIHGHSNNLENISYDDLKFSNQNARCFLAIEIENKVSRKHLMGGALNAAALGRIGLAIAYNEDKLRAFIKLKSYLNFLSNVGKPTFSAKNLLILSADQFLSCFENI